MNKGGFSWKRFIGITAAAKNVNEYLDEQAMYLHTEVVKLEDGRFAVAIVNCY